MDLSPIIDRLPEPEGRAAPEDPWRHVLWITASYLVDDARRWQALDDLASVGVEPRALLAAAPEEIEAAIARGGMRPSMRAGKVVQAANVMRSAGLDRGADLVGLARRDPAAAVKVLTRFRGVSKVVAQRILVRAGVASGLPVESNGLRVLIRLGFGTEGSSWDQTLRRAVAAVGDLPTDPATSWRWLEALRAHGQRVCKQRPRCSECPIRSACPYRGPEA